MKDLLVSTRPSYQHLLMKLWRALLCHSTFWNFAESSKYCWHFHIPWRPLPWVGCWIRTNWRRHFGPCQSLTSFPHLSWLLLCSSLTHSHSFPVMFCFLKCMYKGKKRKLSMSCTTPHLSLQLIHTSHMLLTHFKHLWVFISHCLCHPFFVSLFYILTPSSFLFPYLPWVWLCSSCLSSLSLHTVCPTKDHSCSYGNQLATMLENIIMPAQKEISSTSRELCNRTVLLSNFHML